MTTTQYSDALSEVLYVRISKPLMEELRKLANEYGLTLARTAETALAEGLGVSETSRTMALQQELQRRVGRGPQ